MSEAAERFRRVAGAFTDRVRAVPAAAWDRPAPCEGWVARDVVEHLVEWVPAFFADGGLPPLPAGPAPAEDLVGAWAALADGLQARLDDLPSAAAEVHHPHVGTHRFDDAVTTFVLGDVLVHTWDLARACGLDERLDPDEVHGMLVGIEPMDEVLRASGQYGPRVPVAEGADEQTRLLAFTGRRP